MSQEYTRAVGQRLRAVRVQQGLSLKGVEKKSNGRWKAVVVGSYERGDSAITVVNLDGLAGFYGVPAVELLPDAHVCRPDPRLTLDLTALARLPSRQAGPLSRYAAALQSEHGDHDGQIFTVRVEDLRSLAVVYGMSPATLIDQLVAWAVIPAGSGASTDPNSQPGDCPVSHG
jgi:transcriptional regulator with XRE-family HTH domain